MALLTISILYTLWTSRAPAPVLLVAAVLVWVACWLRWG
jgi:hypothetical protein